MQFIRKRGTVFLNCFQSGIIRCAAQDLVFRQAKDLKRGFVGRRNASVSHMVNQTLVHGIKEGVELIFEIVSGETIMIAHKRAN